MNTVNEIFDNAKEFASLRCPQCEESAPKKSYEYCPTCGAKYVITEAEMYVKITLHNPTCNNANHFEITLADFVDLLSRKLNINLAENGELVAKKGGNNGAKESLQPSKGSEKTR